MTLFLRTVIVLGLTFSAVEAGTIYKIVDEHGNVSYSETPPDDRESAKQIDVDAGPTAEQVEAAKRRHERNQQAAEMLEENRKKREEIIAGENRMKQERQGPSKQTSNSGEAVQRDDVYPYYYPAPPHRPVRPGPIRPGPVLPDRPVHLPAR